jgi:flagellin
MGLRINTNIASLSAQNALYSTTKKLNQALERLSTGFRINRGSDDIVGLAKSEKLRAQIRGIDTVKTNIGSVTSVLGVAEGYLQQLTEIAQQLREVSVQAADGTLNSADRSSLTSKFTDALAEYTRLAQSSNFNGVALLDGSFINKVVQVGVNEGETIAMSIQDARVSTIGQVAIYTSQSQSVQAVTTGLLDFAYDGGIQIVGATTQLVGALSADGLSFTQGSESAVAYAQAINSVSGGSGVTATVLANVLTLTYSTNSHLSSTSGYVMLNGVTVKAASDGDLSLSASDADAATLVNLINGKSSVTGVVAALDATNNTVSLTASDGRNIDIFVNSMSTGVSFFGNVSTQSAIGYRGTFKMTSSSSFTITGASAEFVSAASLSVGISANTALLFADISTAQNAGTAISIVDAVIAQLQSRRGTVGSTINRFEIAGGELASRLENISSAESQIRDADIAAETAILTQQKILQQAGVTVLAQANSSPQIALTLLQNLGG